MTAVVCEQVVFDYPGGVRALDGVDLAVGDGETVAIIGQNGSGKTTLVQHLNGLLRPASGSVRIGEVDTSTARISQLARSVGLAFQNPDRQIFSGSVVSEVSFGARNVGLRGDDLQSAVDESLDAMGLAGERDTNPYDLGYSRRKLLTIASVLAMRTPIVVLDEPTTGQDAHGVERIQTVVADLAADGRTVICISHDLRFVAETFRRVVVMRRGGIIDDGSPAEVFSESHWATLRSTNLEPPFAARVGAKLGLGSTPTTDALVAAYSMN